jgi:hypothetical protein
MTLIIFRTSPPRARSFATTFRGVGRDRLAFPPSQGEPVLSFPEAKAPAPTIAAALGLVAAITALFALAMAA